MSTPITLTTPLPEGQLRFEAMTHTSGISILDETRLQLLSEEADIDPDQLLGKLLTVHVELRDGQKRHFNGFVTRFGIGHHRGRYFGYQAVLRPWPWLLSRRSDCKIFQDMTVPEIVEQVFKNHAGLQNYELRLVRSYRKRTYCVQYRETDFNFISRLLEDEGIYWYFEHTESEHKLIVMDDGADHQPMAGYEELPYYANAGQVQPDVDFVTAWIFERSVFSAKVALRSYNFETPSTNLQVTQASEHGFGSADLEQFDYQGDYLTKDEGQDIADTRIDEQQSQFQQHAGQSNAHGLCTGNTFTLSRHPRADQNIKQLVVQTQISAHVGSTEAGMEGRPQANDDWRCSFSAIPATQQFRPVRRTSKPFVQGPQTAVVTGPAGEEIFTDKYGRVKVQFRWDRYGQGDEKSSCWIRVSHPWAGKGWGAISIPRIGQEVVVDFLEGDPDQPIITGRVYNAESMPPYGLPAAAVVSGIKSNTHKGKGYNQMTMDDTAGKEKITIHAQYDMDTTVEHDQTNTVHNTFTETIKSTTKITITEGTYNHDVKANTATYHVQGALTENYDATQTTTVKSNIITKSTGGSIQITSDTAHVFIDASTKIKLHVGASTISMDSAGNIAIEGVNVAIKGSTSVSIKGGEVTSEADSKHQTKGGIVISTGKASNTVEGGMVMLNP